MIYLVSTSQGRRELVKVLAMALGDQYKIIKPLYNEPQILHGNIYKITQQFASRKIDSVLPYISSESALHDKGWYIGADTLVGRSHKIYSKPSDKDEAFAIIKDIQGTKIRVVTGVCLYSRAVRYAFTSTSYLKICTMSDIEIEKYCHTNDWQNVSGAFKLQGSFLPYIKSISGESSNIVGLPISRIYSMIAPYYVK